MVQGGFIGTCHQINAMNMAVLFCVDHQVRPVRGPIICDYGGCCDKDSDDTCIDFDVIPFVRVNNVHPTCTRRNYGEIKRKSKKANLNVVAEITNLARCVKTLRR